MGSKKRGAETDGGELKIKKAADFSERHGANGNEGISLTDTVVNNDVIDLDDQWFRRLISDWFL